MSLENIINKAKNGLKRLAFTGLIGLALAGLPNEAKAVNSNSIIKDNIEYYMQTDKSVYDLGENVEMLYRVKNLSEEEVLFGFGQSPVWNFWVDKDGENIFTAVKGWWNVYSEFTLTPGESKEFIDDNSPYIWNMKDNGGNLVTLGMYNVTGGLFSPRGYYDYTKVLVDIEIVPEPTTIGLLVAGGIALALSKKRYHPNK